MNRATHGREKSFRRSHKASAIKTSGNAASARNADIDANHFQGELAERMRTVPHGATRSPLRDDLAIIQHDQRRAAKKEDQRRMRVSEISASTVPPSPTKGPSATFTWLPP